MELSSAEVWAAVQVGDTLDPYDYVISSEMMREYRDIVGNPAAAYPTVAGRHSLRAFTARYGPAKLMNVGTESAYFNRVIPDRRLFVTVKVVDKYERRGKPYLIIESETTDEDGRLIEQSRLIGMAAKPTGPLFGEVAAKWEKA